MLSSPNQPRRSKKAPQAMISTITRMPFNECRMTAMLLPLILLLFFFFLLLFSLL